MRSIRGHRLAAILLFLSLCIRCAHSQSVPDFSQAQAMLELLRSCHDNKVSTEAVDRVLSLPGTGLVVQQQNISRRVTVQQYREVLEADCTGKVADVKSAEPGARAAKGVTGLTQDVGPSLVWGRENIPLLESSLAELRRNQSIGNAIPLARKYLPEQNSTQQVPLTPRLYVVMGGGPALRPSTTNSILMCSSARGALPAVHPLLCQQQTWSSSSPMKPTTSATVRFWIASGIL